MNPIQQAALEALKIKYLESIPEKITAIKKIIGNQDLTLLQREFHKIKGTGRTYGFDDITLVAAVIDKQCKALHFNSFTFAEKACQLFQKIYDSQKSQQIYDLQNDPLFKEIQ